MEHGKHQRRVTRPRKKVLRLWCTASLHTACSGRRFSLWGALTQHASQDSLPADL